MTGGRPTTDGRSTDRRDLSDRLVAQFSDRGDRADVWRALDLLFPTEEFLNMGYSRRYQTHLLGSPQLRLVERVVAELSAMDAGWVDGRLLDLGSGRGGATAHVAERYGADAVGVDLVSHNVAIARDQTATRFGSADDVRAPSFVVGDATRLPFDRDAFSAAVAVDSLVYVPDKRDAFAELARVLEPGGVCVVSDLLATTAGDEDPTLRRFREAWDMPPLWTLHEYRAAIEAVGLSVPLVTDLSAHSLRRFRKWTWLFLAVADSPLGGLLERALTRLGLDPEAIVAQVRTAHEALPDLRHVLVPIYGTGE